MILALVLIIQFYGYYKVEFNHYHHNSVGLKPPPPSKIRIANEKDVATGLSTSNNDVTHDTASLSCEKFGGPPNDSPFAKDMVYWSDIPSDTSYQSAFFDPNADEKYLTFEPDGGGWNNIRMAMETVLVMAHAMGRTLVLPPEQKMYLLGKQSRNKQKVHFSFNDFFQFDSIDAEHMTIITMEEFLSRTAMKGLLVHKETGVPTFPPDNRTDWNGLAIHEKQLYEYLRNVTHVRNWKPNNCLVVIPATPENDKVDEPPWSTIMKDLSTNRPHGEDYINNPTPVNASFELRMREAQSALYRPELCMYDDEMQNAFVVHFMCYHKQRARLLTNFYSFLFFEDWKHDLWAKRFVRDHIRYLDELQCAAARVVEELHSKSLDTEYPHQFDSIHVRRGDFQFKQTRLDADDLYKKSKHVLTPGMVLFISTDERDKKFFKPFADHYPIFFLDDFKHLFPDLNTNYYGMLDQLIASKGRVFVGTYFSTFSGYINRMRGYYISKYKKPGYEEGTIESYYFTPDKLFNIMTYYRPITNPWQQEFPISWRDIDHGVVP